MKPKQLLLALLSFMMIDPLMGQVLDSAPLQPVASAVVNMTDLSNSEARMPTPLVPVKGEIRNKAKVPEPEGQVYSPAPEGPSFNRTMAASPNPVFDYQAAPDEAQGGGASGTYNIPPDTYGAVGLDKVFITVNNNYKILNKTTGAQISLVSMPFFWSTLGTDGAGAFDPRVIYDPYNNRWILSAVSNAQSANSRILVGISQTHDPSGNYWLFAYDGDPGTTLWADYPTMGFNKNWVVINVNMFTMANALNSTRLIILNYPQLLTGASSGSIISASSSYFTLHPATTFSQTEETMYMVGHLGSSAATYSWNTITGTAAAPVVNLAAIASTRPGGGWIQPAGNSAPQNCLSSCPAGPPFIGIDVGDSRISGNLVFRNGSVWYSQTVAFGSPHTRTSAQWTKLNTFGVYQDGGRVEDLTATATNGGRWYTYPSLAVNAANDVVMGFTKTESDGFAGAAYALRYGTDGAGLFNDPVVYKDGEDFYNKDFGGSRVRWGDYSHTLVDPVDDASFITIQEYAKLRASPALGGNLCKWGTWLAKIAPNPNLSSASGNWSAAGSWNTSAVPTSAQHVSVMAGNTVTLDVDPLAATITVNEGATLIINGDRTISGKLIVYGTLNIGSGKLIIGNNDVFLSGNATINGASANNYIVTNGTGSVTKIIAAGGSFLFPVSPNTTSYNGLSLSNNSGPAEVYTVRVSTGVTPPSSSNINCVQRTWNISEMTSGSNSVALTFRWAAAEHGLAFNASTAYAYRYNGMTYQLASAMTAPVLNSGTYSSTTLNPVTTLSPWILASSGTLPIELEYFTGVRTSDDQHVLNWKAVCSADAHFELERSRNATEYSTIISIDADYNRCLLPFQYVDLSPLKGKNYYRIKLRDETGKISYSQVVLLLNSNTGFELVNLQPNPASHTITLNVSSARKQNLRYYVSDINGRRVLHGNLFAQAGLTQKELDLDLLLAGTYVVTMISEQNDKRSVSFIKQ